MAPKLTFQLFLDSVEVNRAWVTNYQCIIFTTFVLSGYFACLVFLFFLSIKPSLLLLVKG